MDQLMQVLPGVETPTQGRAVPESGSAKTYEIVGKVLDTLMGASAAYSHSAIFEFTLTGRPRLVYDNLSSVADPSALERFLAGTFVLSPYYQAFKSNTLPTFCRPSDLDFEPTLGGKCDATRVFPHISLKPAALADEVCIAVTQRNCCIIYLAMRNRDSSAFSEIEMGRILSFVDRAVDLMSHSLSPICLARSGQQTHENQESRGPQTQRSVGISESCEDNFSFIEKHLTDKLTRREKGVTVYTLQGKSVDAIARLLEISPHTVRVHLRNAYGKLGLRNRLELIGMFTRRVHDLS